MNESKDTSRIGAFSDGVFAIAITLLILEIKVPAIDTIHNIKDLWKGLWNLWPNYFAFIFSFGSILVAWVNHHHFFNSLDSISRPFMYANGFLLLNITFLPFPTALLGEYIGTEYAQPAISFFCGSSVINTFSWFIVGRSVLKPKPLVHSSHKIELLNKSLRSVYLGLFITIATTILSFWFPYTALFINASILILWIIISLNEKLES